MAPDLTVRGAELADSARIGQLLHGFNREYDDPTPEPAPLAERISDLLAAQ